jgi:uncharacterized membrane protein YcgQ (UPF0703/DUF1980 family)
MREYLSKCLLQTREGLILIIFAFIYLVIGLSAKLSPYIGSAFGFFGLIARFMPVALLLFFIRIGGFRREFQTTIFNTLVMLIVAFIPVFVVVNAVISR